MSVIFLVTNNCYLRGLKGIIAIISIVILVNNHPDLTYSNIDEYYSNIDKNGFIYDYWNRYTNLSTHILCGNYFSVGYTGNK